MEAKEILERKEVLNHEDIKIIFQCGKNSAYKRILEIRSVSDILGVPGKVHKNDYFKYIEKRGEANGNA